MAVNGSKPLSEPGEGTRVDIRHLAPTPEGRGSSAKRRMTRVDARHVEFIVRATEDIEESEPGARDQTRPAGEAAGAETLPAAAFDIPIGSRPLV